MRFPDLWLLLPVLLLNVLGLLVTASIAPLEFPFQLKISIVAVILFIILFRINFEVIQLMAWPLYLLTILGLIAIILFVDPVRGSRRWLQLGGFHFQFSELAKLSLLLLISHLTSWYQKNQYAHFLAILGLIILPVLLTFLEPDLGSAIIIFVAGFLALISLKPRKRFIFSIILLFCIAIPVFYTNLASYQKARIEHFLNPTQDPLGASYNQIQATIAVGSGQLLGKGLGKGTQSHLQFLPEKQTDFFFASLAEEFGFIGSLLVIVLFGIIAWRLLSLAAKTKIKAVKAFLAGTFGIIFLQAFIHIGINVGILPVTGIPLPFLSVGGSSMMVNWLLLGIVLAAEGEIKDRKAYEI